MDVPQRIRPFSDADFTSSTAVASSSRVNAQTDRMIVPDRILVAGGRAIVGEKQPPPEIALDMHTLPPVRYTHKSLETPPAKLTLQDRTFPTVVDEAEVRSLRRKSIGHEGQSEPAVGERRRNSAIQVSQADGLPSSSTLSLLTSAEETVLLRNHVRKLTTRVMKLEDDVQNLNTHLAWIEGLGGALVLVLVLKSLKRMFSG